MVVSKNVGIKLRIKRVNFLINISRENFTTTTTTIDSRTTKPNKI